MEMRKDWLLWLCVCFHTELKQTLLNSWYSKPWASAWSSKQRRIQEGPLRRSLPLKPRRSLPP